MKNYNFKAIVTLAFGAALIGAAPVKAQWSTSPVTINTIPTTQLNNTSFTGINGGTNNYGALEVVTQGGYLQLGPQYSSNASTSHWCHMITDRSSWWFNTAVTANGPFCSYYTNDLIFVTGNTSSSNAGTTRMTIKNSNGYVGIGTTTPSEILHVSGADASGLTSIFANGTYSLTFGENMSASNYSNLTQLHDNGIFWQDGASGNTSSGFVLAPHASATYGLRIASNGYVGIGTASPANPLDVNGNISSNATVSGSTVSASTSVTAPIITANQNLNVGSGNNSIAVSASNASITSPGGNIGFANNNLTTTGTVNAGNFNISNSITAPVIYADRITRRSGDSIIHIGDSSIAFDPTNNVYGISGIFSHISGIGIGTKNNVTSNTYCEAVGNFNTVNSQYGLALGNSNTLSAAGSIALGTSNTLSASSCFAIGSGLTNSTSTSIMMGINGPGLFIDPTNKVGIGTTTPVYPLDVVGNANIHGILSVGPPNAWNMSMSTTLVQPSAGGKTFENYLGFNVLYNGSPGTFTCETDNIDNGGAIIFGDVKGGLYFTNVASTGGSAQTLAGHTLADNSYMHTTSDGKVIIGGLTVTTPGNYKLYVANGILTEQVMVTPQGSANWPDYVFGDKYKLQSLPDLEKYIKDNKHLPEVPSAADIQKDGINLGEMDATLLKKVEELTLYSIQLQKQVDGIHELKEEISQLKEEIAHLKQNTK